MQDKAARLEDEIQNSTSNNRHILEERGLLNREEKDETGLYQNEEMKYSGVVRTIGKFKCYKPVAKGVTALNDAILDNLHADSFIIERAPVVEKAAPQVISTTSKIFDINTVREFTPNA
mgnify:FL=1